MTVNRRRSKGPIELEFPEAVKDVKSFGALPVATCVDVHKRVLLGAVIEVHRDIGHFGPGSAKRLPAADNLLGALRSGVPDTIVVDRGRVPARARP